MSLSKEDNENILDKLFQKYMKNLQERPVLTKACTSGAISFLSNIISQKIAPNPDGKIAWRSVAAYTSFGFFITGPLFHNFYLLLDKLFPRKDKMAPMKNQDIAKMIIFDRLVLAPPYLLVFLYAIAILELQLGWFEHKKLMSSANMSDDETASPILIGQGTEVAMKRVKATFWTILKMNWRVFTIVQYINFRYVPIKYRVLFGNVIALFFSIYVAVKRRQTPVGK
ncbi:hypothetical protein CHS0354_032848 [Potamilus streckersoni]|uniref:Peroxisomal membrane protein 2 n=1 Tax=Potamilus streckersoni TaxID=2493646 RepID=A0AAE0VRS6_9BIVA|nr:hypothetical protein CHS0354_032848 [Potamilus streckersoni]